MLRVALALAYDGVRFHGSQRQPGKRTVEGDLLRALAALKAIRDAKSARFLAASRTDRGVSAAANVVAFDTRFSIERLPTALNAKLEDAWIVGAREVEAGFNPRHATARRYRYFLPESEADPKALRDALQLFVGEHDFSSFARVEAHRSPTRRIDGVSVAREPPFLAIDFEGPDFLWNQIRRIVAASVKMARREASVEAVRLALKGKTRVDLGVAPPEPLVLLQVKYDFEIPRVDAPLALESLSLRRVLLSTLERPED